MIGRNVHVQTVLSVILLPAELASVNKQIGKVYRLHVIDNVRFY